MKKFLVNKEHQLLLHKPWLWETKAYKVLIVGALFNITTLLLLITNVGVSSGLLFFSTSIISLLIFGWWIFQLNSHSSTAEFGQTTTEIGQKQFKIYFATSLLLFAPSLIVLLKAAPINLIGSINVLEVFIGLGVQVAVMLTIWKLVGFRALTIAIVILILTVVFISFIAQLHEGVAFLIFMVCGFVMLIFLGVKLDWYFRPKNRPKDFKVTPLDIAIQVLSPVLVYFATTILLFLPVAFLVKFFNIDFGISIWQFDCLISLFVGLHFYIKDIVPRLRAENLNYLSRPKEK